MFFSAKQPLNTYSRKCTVAREQDLHFNSWWATINIISPRHPILYRVTDTTYSNSVGRRAVAGTDVTLRTGIFCLLQYGSKVINI